MSEIKLSFEGIEKKVEMTRGGGDDRRGWR